MPNNKQRRDAARRQLEKQLLRRQEQQRARRRFLLIASIIGAVVLLGIVVGFVVATGKDSSTASDNPVISPGASPTARATPGTCDFTASGTAAKNATAPPSTAPITGTVTVKVATTQGPMTFTLNRESAPCTVASFVALVQQKYFDKTPCHRLVTSGIYVLQCGDPSGTGGGGPGYSIPDEATGQETYPAGTIAMARTSEAHSGGSQFFIVYQDSPSLARNLGAQQYTVFGKVTAGLPVVTRVAAKGSTPANDGKPVLPITLDSLTVAS